MMHLKTKTTLRRQGSATRRAHRELFCTCSAGFRVRLLEASLRRASHSRSAASRQAEFLLASARRQGLFHPRGGSRLWGSGT